MSSDDRLIAHVEAALRRRFGASSAGVIVTHCKGTWRALAHVTRDDGTITVQPRARHLRKRDAVRAVALAAGLRDEDFAEPPSAPTREATEVQLALEIDGGTA